MPYTAILTASDYQEDLIFIKEEFQNLEQSFNSMPENTLEVVINRNATDKALFNAYMSKTDIRIFHFSGHAGDRCLQMDDGKLTNGNVLASMMQNARHLQLVFLNGCATYDMVDFFLKNGAKVVIATSAPVFDKLACEFSKNFYFGLCEKGLSIGKSYAYAQGLLSSFMNNPDVSSDKIYVSEVKQFVNDAVRTIPKNKRRTDGKVSWGLYLKEELTEIEKRDILDWQAVIEGDIDSQVIHTTPSFDFLISLAGILKKIRRQGIGEAKEKSITTILEKLPNAGDWGDAATTDLIFEMQKVVLSPLAESFRALINLSKDKALKLKDKNKDTYFELLGAQLNLYRDFIRTATLIMLSDLMESVILMNLCKDTDSQKIFKDLFTNEYKEFADLIGDITTCKADLSNTVVGIKLMRFIVSLLNDARKKSNASDNLNSTKTQSQDLLSRIFNPFITEYKGEPSDLIEKAAQNAVHQEIQHILQLEDDALGRLSPPLLAIFCDRMESGLIKLFENHGYLFLYDIVSVGKVEVNKRRDDLERDILHELFVATGRADEVKTKYGDPYADNHSVILVPDRKKVDKYLSLTPFIINAGCCFNEENWILFYFLGKEQAGLRYGGLADREKAKLTLGVLPNAQPDDVTIEMSAGIINLSKKSKQEQKVYRKEFNKISDQYRKIEEQLLSLTV